MPFTMDTSPRYKLTYMVNNKITCVLENLPAYEVYTNGVPSEAYTDIEGNRWHALNRVDTRSIMVSMVPGETKVLAYQVPPEIPDLDTEVIYLSKE
jgi:hypothetical protein